MNCIKVKLMMVYLMVKEVYYNLMERCMKEISLMESRKALENFYIKMEINIQEISIKDFFKEIQKKFYFKNTMKNT